MTRGSFDPGFDGLPKILPIFPLPGVLLLPGGQLPLNIFEARYLAMVRDALGGERTIGMIQPLGGEGDVGAAKIYATGCAGRISAFSETGDGRYLITLSGLIRFEVERELPLLEGYRRAVPDYNRYRDDLETDTGPFNREGFLKTLGAYLDVAGIEGDWSAIEDTDNEHLVTSLAMHCPFAAPEKQALLEAMTLPERAETLSAMMVMAIHGKQADGAHH